MGAIRITVIQEVPHKVYEARFNGFDLETCATELVRWLKGDDLPERMDLAWNDRMFYFYTRLERIQWANGFHEGHKVFVCLAGPLKPRCNDCGATITVPKHPGPFRCKNCKADYSLSKDGNVTRIWGKDCGVPY